MPSLTSRSSPEYSSKYMNGHVNGASPSRFEEDRGMYGSASAPSSSTALATTSKPTINGNTYDTTNGNNKTTASNGIVRWNHLSNGSTMKPPRDTIGNSLDQTRDVKVDSSYRPIPGDFAPPSKSDERDEPSPATRSEVEAVFSEFAGLIHASSQPMPDRKSTLR